MKETKDPFLHGELGLPCRKRAIVLHCTQRETRLSDSQNDFWIRFPCTTGWLNSKLVATETTHSRQHLHKHPVPIFSKDLLGVDEGFARNAIAQVSSSFLRKTIKVDQLNDERPFLIDDPETLERSFQTLFGPFWVETPGWKFASHPVVKRKRIQKSFWESLSRVSRWLQWSTIARFLQWRG